MKLSLLNDKLKTRVCVVLDMLEEDDFSWPNIDTPDFTSTASPILDKYSSISNFFSLDDGNDNCDVFSWTCVSVDGGLSCVIEEELTTRPPPPISVGPLMIESKEIDAKELYRRERSRRYRQHVRHRRSFKVARRKCVPKLSEYAKLRPRSGGKFTSIRKSE
jgi:hypothetical protein